MEYTIKEFKEGQDAWNRYHESEFIRNEINPYEVKSDKWKSWNRGWSTNFNGIN